jgi:hypothetical protein
MLAETSGAGVAVSYRLCETSPCSCNWCSRRTFLTCTATPAPDVRQDRQDHRPGQGRTIRVLASIGSPHTTVRKPLGDKVPRPPASGGHRHITDEVGF